MNPAILPWLEWTAVAFSVTYVILLAREIVWAWPAGILGSLLSLLVVFDVKLYNDVWLYGLYVILGVYGWHTWVSGGSNSTSLKLVHVGVKEGVFLFFLGVLGTLLLGFFFDQYTDADIPYWDAFTSSFSVVGTYMQARKQLQNWLLWLLVDGVYIGVYYYKGLEAFALLSLLYLFLAAYGYLNWRRLMSQQAKNQEAENANH